MLTNILKYFLFFTFLIQVPAFSKTVRESRYMVNFGAGLPQLASLEMAYRLVPNWQIGLSYGLVSAGGGGISPQFSIPSQNVTLANNTFITLEKPTITTNLNSYCPFIRFYPNPTNFYVQLTVGLLKISNDFDSAILDVNGNTITDASYKGTISIIQMLPTLSMGHVFSTKIFFFNVNMGLTIVATAQVESSIISDLPSSLGGNSDNEAAMNSLKATSTNAINSGLEEFRSLVAFLPSFYMSFGFFF